VHKFGGSSLADAGCFRRVAAIVEELPEPRVALVLSACRGVTDELIRLVATAEGTYQAACEEALRRLQQLHEGLAAELLEPGARGVFLAQFEGDLSDLRRMLQAVTLVRSAGRDLRDLVSGFGELWSTHLFAAFLEGRGHRKPVRWVDAREIVVVEWGPLGPGVQWTQSRSNVARRIAQDTDATLVIPGFVATDTRGLQTTLGRNGSDFSGSIFGALLDAREIVIWTDVDGVLSADPRQVPDAKIIDSLSYSEAMELAYFGAKVIHPQTMAPAVEKGIPIRIRNTFAPTKAGTLIVAVPSSALVVKGITSIDDVALVNLEGAGMIGVPGTAHRLFGALHDADISVTLISQGSSEHSRSRATRRRSPNAWCAAPSRWSCVTGRSRASS
jgi:aspartokinase/homoserine dehydrogenase 1